MKKLIYQNVVFDFDSTLTSIEGLDAIAQKKGLLGEVKKITHSGMNGDLPFSQSIRLRLKLIKPTSPDFIWLAGEYKRNLLDDAKSTICKIQKSGSRVHLVSGGPRIAIEPVARLLGFKHKNVWASCLTIGSDQVVEADHNCLMTGDKGKIEVIKKIRETGATVMIGDGMTDYEAGKFADTFIGFGGIVKRDKLRELSRVYIDEPKLARILQYLK